MRGFSPLAIVCLSGERLDSMGTPKNAAKTSMRRMDSANTIECSVGAVVYTVPVKLAGGWKKNC